MLRDVVHRELPPVNQVPVKSTMFFLLEAPLPVVNLLSIATYSRGTLRQSIRRDPCMENSTYDGIRSAFAPSRLSQRSLPSCTGNWWRADNPPTLHRIGPHNAPSCCRRIQTPRIGMSDQNASNLRMVNDKQRTAVGLFHVL